MKRFLRDTLLFLLLPIVVVLLFDLYLRNMEDIRSICETHNIPYWPYNDDERFTREDFFNPDHLNKQGAAKFSRLLDERLYQLSAVQTDP